MSTQYPNEGGTFKRNKSGDCERIGTRQKPNPGKSAKRAAAEKVEANKSADKPSGSTTGKAGKQEG